MKNNNDQKIINIMDKITFEKIVCNRIGRLPNDEVMLEDHAFKYFRCNERDVDLIISYRPGEKNKSWSVYEACTTKIVCGLTIEEALKRAGLQYHG